MEQFTWTESEDPELYLNGVTVAIAVGRSKSIQKFVEALSYKIEAKCDWSWTAGRAHIDVPKNKHDEAIEVIKDSKFMEQFIVPYSRESYDDETYFELASGIISISRR